MVRRTANGARQQMSNALLENRVRFEADGVKEALTFQELVDVRRGEGGITSEGAAQVPSAVTLDDGFQNVAPTIGAVDIRRKC